MKPCKICGESAELYEGKTFYAHCRDWSCCRGPNMDTPKEAKTAWDDLMGGSEPEPRRPVAASFDRDCITAVCSDGSACYLTMKNMEWRFLPPIPDTPADRSGNE